MTETTINRCIVETVVVTYILCRPLKKSDCFSISFKVKQTVLDPWTFRLYLKVEIGYPQLET